MANFDGARVGIGMYALGYAKAFSRWQAAEEAEDAVEAYLALCESLDWAHALDEEIARSWRPRGVVAENPWWRWREDPALGGGAYFADAMAGLGYVRNRVHHHLADALETVSDPTRPGHLAFIWRHADELPGRQARGHEVERREAYVRALAGSPVETALGLMSERFVFIGSLLDPPRPKPRPPVVTAVSE
jgi:hypothetical protein